MVQLVDILTLDASARICADGSLVAEVFAARTGLQDYVGREVDPDNNHGLRDRAIVKVYRPESEVFKADSLATFAAAPVTVDHPSTPVTADNWRALGVGEINGDVVRDGQCLARDAAIATERAAKSQYDMAKNGAEGEDKEAALALVDRAKGAVNEVKSYFKEITLTSPINGEVTDVYPKQGELVGAGAPIMSIVDLNDIWFTFNVREDLLGELKMGKTFKIKVPALENQVVEVKVTYIKALASYATWKATKTTGQFDVKTFEVRARPTAKVANLRPGMTALFEETVK